MLIARSKPPFQAPTINEEASLTDVTLLSGGAGKQDGGHHDGGPHGGGPHGGGPHGSGPHGGGH